MKKRQPLRSFPQKTCSKKFTQDREYEKKATQRKWNMKRAQHKKQHEDIATKKKSNMKKVQQEKSKT